MRMVKVAATQMSCSWNRRANLVKAEALVRSAAEKGAQIILLEALFQTPYFCKEANEEYRIIAKSLDEDIAVSHFKELARELKVVLPVSFYEKANDKYYNSVAIIDADGTVLGVYRKTHIPYSLPYDEKYYFEPGDTGFKVWDTCYGRIGIGVCFDQWFPETTRSLVINGAEIVLYPTTLGTEQTDTYTLYSHWKNTIAGQAAANMVPIVVANRMGKEVDQFTTIHFLGKSFIADNHGVTVKKLDETNEGVIVAEFDLDELSKERDAFGLLTDRRPQMYDKILNP